MRLLNTSTIELESFNSSEIPPYAILSHRWEAEEVLFEDMNNGSAKTRKGFGKVSGSCKQAAMDGFDYMWIDTCCINKESSAELSEAINSMYAWYGKAEVGYAYLSDVPEGVGPSDAEFVDSEWFKRGWTLQELVAPLEVVFFTSGWTCLGTKYTLRLLLWAITGISPGILAGIDDPRSLSVARRMSWAAGRQTTRPEDVAYCLLGLFDISMPMLYGEGEKAFVRLQEEIMRLSDDQTLFAWVDKDAHPDALYGLLAKSPAWFAETGFIEPYEWEFEVVPFSMTNKGLQISLPLFEADLPRVKGEIGALISCRKESTGRELISIFMAPSKGLQQFARIRANELFWCESQNLATHHMQPLYVRQNISSHGRQSTGTSAVLRIQTGPSFEQSYKICKIMGFTQWDLILSNNLPEENTSPEIWLDKEYMFKMDQTDNRVVAILILRYTTHLPYICVLFASSSMYEWVFDAYSLHDAMIYDFHTIPRRSQSYSQPGSRIAVDLDSVRVEVCVGHDYSHSGGQGFKRLARRECYSTRVAVVESLLLEATDFAGYIACK